jgi:hypothetical protein
MRYSSCKRFTGVEPFQDGVPFGLREHSGKRAGLAKSCRPFIGAQQGLAPPLPRTLQQFAPLQQDRSDGWESRSQPALDTDQTTADQRRISRHGLHRNWVKSQGALVDLAMAAQFRTRGLGARSAHGQRTPAKILGQGQCQRPFGCPPWSGCRWKQRIQTPQVKLARRSLSPLSCFPGSGF